MREYLDIITEGVGLANRKPGEKFANPQGDILTFQSLDFFPGKDSYEDEETTNTALLDLGAQLGIDPQEIQWANAQGSNKAFGIARFVDGAGKDYLVGRWFQKINANKTLNRFPNDLPGGFKYQSKAAVKENSGYKPTEILTQLQNQTPASIVKQIVAKFGADSDEVRATNAFMEQDFPMNIPRGEMNAEAFTNYFCEILQPMALIMGKNVGGNADEAEQIFFGGSGYSDCTISFNAGTTDGLFDSLLVNPQGKQIKISSKAAAGANASIVNLLKSVQDMRTAPAGQKLLKQYAEAVSIMEIIKNGGHTDGCLNLAIALDFISPEEKQQVKSLAGMGPDDDVMSVITSDKLQGLYNGRNARDMSRIIPIEHMLASIAYPIAEIVNTETDFGEAASAILNHSALVQMYTLSSNSDDTINVNDFQCVYPSNTVTGVLMRADKTYMSTQGKGNFVFKILKNGASDAETEIADVSTDIPNTQPVKKKAAPGQTTSNVKAQPRGGDLDNKSLGRERRT
jgi:hypothetical protein